MKCDEGRPSCSVCKDLGVSCGGYEKSIFFDFENDSEDGTLRYRRPLFSEEERRCMSEWLTTSIQPRSALWHIAQIEEECEGTVAAGEIAISRGPFGVLKFGQLQHSISDKSATISNREDSSSDRPFTSEDHILSFTDEFEALAAQSSVESEPTWPYLPELWDASMDLDEGPMIFEEVFQDGDLIPATEISPATPILPSLNDVGFSMTFDSSSMIGSTVPSDAVCLIKYYSTVIINLLTPFKHTKTPWHILFIPNCKNCLAALTLGENVDAAALAAFYGTLAMSAFSMGTVSKSSICLNKARSYRYLAQRYTQQMLETAYNIPKVSKYKSILMALITMIQVSMFSGSRNQMEYYFVEAEKFIRLKGLKQRKSRKVRLLHHCYAFERIFYESLLISDINSDQRYLVRAAVEASGLVIRGQDSMHFRLHRWSDLDQAMAVEKDQEEGENDLHLELPGKFSATLYPEVFGVPEQWIVLVSLVIRLGREKDAAEQLGEESHFAIGEFLKYAKVIERRINQLQVPSQHPRISCDVQMASDQQVLEDLLVAMQSALAIYFYRRIYNVEASILQPKVKIVRDCLLRCEHNNAGSEYGSARFIWPAFIAACEAEDPEIKVSFTDWFKNCLKRSGLPLFAKSLKGIEQIWQEKWKSKERNFTWLDLMQTNAVIHKPNFSVLHPSI